MANGLDKVSRRDFLAGAAAASMAVAAATDCSGSPVHADPTEARHAFAADPGKALVAITLDLEMSMHYPQWGMTEWNYAKGNLDQPTKHYIVEACRRVRAKGGVTHCFVVGRVFEQENVDWLKQLLRDGHLLGNHTYDHVNVWSKTPGEIQWRFRRAPWLIHDKSVRDVIRDNIRLTEMAMAARLGAKPVGFRTPGGSAGGLLARPDLQTMLLELGYPWVSSMARHVDVKPEKPDAADFRAVAQAQQDSQPFVYPTGLLEIPMSPIGDVAAFRRERQKWRIGDFLRMLEENIRWTIEHRAVFDLLTHPSIMVCEDPKFQAYELICDLVNQSGGKAVIVGLDTIAERARQRKTPAPPLR
jgi:peptidoglycan/xylan/chitin deacetylase (PgdA/CDA1 family)